MLADLWRRGLISGEMHLGTGEEAVVAGVVSHLVDGDALALDHRPTPALVVRGLDLVSLLREMLGREDGLCRGRGGHTMRTVFGITQIVSDGCTGRGTGNHTLALRAARVLRRDRPALVVARALR